jgi:excisionase family DNA binding protein
MSNRRTTIRYAPTGAFNMKRLLDVDEVAAMLGCGRSYVYDLLYRGELRSIKLGRLRRVTVDEVEQFVDSKLDRAVSG